MEKKLHIAIRITENAKNTTIEDCEFIDCGIEDSGDGTNMIQNRFSITKEWLSKKPTWLKVIMFLATASITAIIARVVEKLWV